MHIAIINGPNLHCIGSREVEIYGARSMQEYLSYLATTYPQVQLSYMQTHHEGEIIAELYRLADLGTCRAIVLNAGAYTHTSIAILDAIRAISVPVIEVHLSNIYARESYRHKSLLAQACRGQISGFGLESYRLAIDLIAREDTQTNTLKS